MRFRVFIFLLWGCLLSSCESAPSQASEEQVTEPLPTGLYLQVLGIAQDAGYPQTNCRKTCCAKVWSGQQAKQHVSCLALIDPVTKQAWLFDATPDFREQWQQLTTALPGLNLAGIFLTHAHIGHYTGLMQLGHEVMGAREIPVYAMPRMGKYLTENGPWSQLVDFQNIVLHPLVADSSIVLTGDIRVTPMLVPHRDEFSETVGFAIEQQDKSVLFIPDIDKWNRWDRDIRTLIRNFDRAYLDGTFFANGELPGRDMSKIPHPFVAESMALLANLPKDQRQNIYFIHFNHTNPLLQTGHPARDTVLQAGFNLAAEGQRFSF